MEWTPSRIRLLRQTGLCLSQPGFARALGFARRTLGNAERGAHPPSLALRRALDRQLELASAIQRNRFLAAIATDPGAAPLPDELGPVAESVELLRQVEASDLGSGTLDQLEELVERLGFDYFAMPPAEFRATVLTWRRYVARLLDGRVTLAQRRRLYDVAGWLSGLLAEVSLALGEEAASHCVAALTLAREIGDPRLAGWVLGTRAQIALYTGDPRDSLGFARVGRQIAPRGSAALVRVCTHDARTSARIGDRRSAETALRAAEHAWLTLAESPARSIYSFGSSYLPYCAATTCVWLREPKRARVHAERAVKICDVGSEPPVGRAIARIDLGIALAHDAEPEAASAVGLAALDVCVERLTEPVKRRTDELLTALAPFPAKYRNRVEERCTWTSN